MKVICLALLAVGSRSMGVGVGDVGTVVEAFKGELKEVKNAHQELKRDCQLEARSLNKHIRGEGREAADQESTMNTEGDAQAAFESKRDSLTDDLQKVKDAYALEQEGAAYDPEKCTAQQQEYQDLLDAVDSAMTSISDKKTEITGALLLQVQKFQRLAGKENMNSCMATVEQSDQTVCDAHKNQGDCEDNQCSWQILYTYSGGKITNMLKKLYEQFEDEKHEHKKQCANMENAHNLKESAKQGARENLETQMTLLETGIETADQAAQAAEAAKVEADKAMKTALKNKADSENTLSQKTATCERESKTLSEQQTAIEEVIPMLEGLEETKHSATHPGATTFLQLSHFTRRLSPAQRVKEHLERFVAKNPKANFAALMSKLTQAITFQTNSSGVKKGVFTKVMGLINDMVARLNQQVRNENQAYEHCKQQFTSNFASFSDTDKKMAEDEASISELAASLRQLDVAIVDTKNGVKEAKDAITEANEEHRNTMKTSKLMEMDATKCMETCDSAVRIVKHKFGTTESNDSAKGGRMSTLMEAVDGLRAKCEGSRDEAKLTQSSGERDHTQFVHDKNNEIANGERLLNEQTSTHGTKKESKQNKHKSFNLLERKVKGLNRFWNSLQKQCLPTDMWAEERPEEPETVWAAAEGAYQERKSALQNEIQALNDAHATLNDANV